MALTIGGLVSDLGLEVAAGTGGTDSAVRWVHISELTDPTPWLSGGELLLTTGLQLAGETEQREYLERVADHGLAGLGFGVGIAHEHIPQAMVDVADARGFPVFEVPYEVPFIAITEKASAHLVNEHYALLQRAISTHEQLERLVIEEQGLDGVADALCSVVGGVALVLDGHGEVLAHRGVTQPLSAEAVASLGAEVFARSRNGSARGFQPGGELAGRALALPVARAAAGHPLPQAWLAAVKDEGALGEFDRLVLHQAVTVVAVELLRRRVAEDTERRLAGDVLSAMASGALAGEDLARRLEPFGLRDRVGVLVIEPPRALRAEVEPALAAAVRDEASAGLVAAAGALACALMAQPRGGDADVELFALAERIRARVSREAGAELAAGAGRSVAPGDLRRAFHEARCALEARTLAAGDGLPPLATYRDLGSFQLLLSLQDDEALRLFCDAILSPIEDGEGAYGGELMRSLETFIECNGQWERAAKQLFCHRHTLRYRIRRVEELTGRSLDSARDRIDFWLALRGRELIGQSGRRGGAA